MEKYSEKCLEEEKMKKKPIKIGAILLAGVLTVGIWGETKTSAAQETVMQEKTTEEKYNLIQVYSGTVEEMVDIQCVYQWGNEEDLAFQIDRKIVEKILVEKGDIVKKGDLLAYLDVSEAEKQLKVLEHEIKVAEMELAHTIQLKNFDLETVQVMFYYTEMDEGDKKNRDDKLEDVEHSYQDKIEDMQDALEIDKARLQEMRDYCEKGKLYAGMDGVIAYVKNNQEGEYCKKDQKVLNIYDDRSGAFKVMNGREYLKEGKEYIVKAGSGSDEQQYIVIAQKKEEDIYLALKEADPALTANTKGNVTLVTQKKEEVPVLDKNAVYHVEDRYYVYVLDENGIRRMKDITVGLQGNDKYEITGGLEIGDWVIR